MWRRLFKQNQSSRERALRVVVGLGLLSLVFVGPMTYLGLVGLVPLVTGLAGSCPAYGLFGISTCKAQAKLPQT